MSSRTTAGRFPGLKNSPVVMVWRRISDLERTRDFAANVLGWPRLGEGDHAHIYDAGGVFVGYWVQDEHNGSNGSSSAAHRRPAYYAPAPNPASEFVLAPAAFGRQVKMFKEMNDSVAPAVKDEDGEFLSFVDDDGNYTAYYRPQLEALTAKVGAKLTGLLDDGGNGVKGRGRAKVRNRFVGCNLLASDLRASQKFYKDVLGLRVLQSRKGEVKFDAGTLILSLRPEPVLGLLRSLRRGQRLSGDRLTFYVADIEAAAEGLRRRGVEFPKGVEDSPYGRQAVFYDPDGRALALLQPAGDHDSAAPGSALNRILKNEA